MGNIDLAFVSNVAINISFITDNFAFTFIFYSIALKSYFTLFLNFWASPYPRFPWWLRQ